MKETEFSGWNFYMLLYNRGFCVCVLMEIFMSIKVQRRLDVQFNVF